MPLIDDWQPITKYKETNYNINQVIESAVINPGISSEFEVFEKKSDILKDVRREAIGVVNQLGFPTTRHEEWKYTNLKTITSHQLEFGKVTSIYQVTREDVDRFRIAGKNELVLVFENGRYVPSLSDVIPQNANIKISSLADSMETEVVQNYLGKVAAYQNETFVALNTAFILDGIVVHVTANSQIARPIHFMHISNSGNAANVTNIRNLIVADEGSKVSVTESYHSLNNTCKGLINTVTEVVVKANAFVEHVKAQLDAETTNQINFTQVNQEKDSTFDTVTVTLSGALVRNNLHIRLNGVNCTSHLFGLYILDGEQVVDNHTLVDHAMPNCFSNELYKGIIGGKASGVFNGKIFVRKDAQKTNAYQSNKNILLSDEAQINTKPQLEILADDVKCTHGATTGQMDEDALFYLRARGIGEQSAKALLNIAFAGDVLNNIKNEELKNNLLDLAVEKLHKNEY